LPDDFKTLKEDEPLFLEKVLHSIPVVSYFGPCRISIEDGDIDGYVFLRSYKEEMKEIVASSDSVEKRRLWEEVRFSAFEVWLKSDDGQAFTRAAVIRPDNVKAILSLELV